MDSPDASIREDAPIEKKLLAMLNNEVFQSAEASELFPRLKREIRHFDEDKPPRIWHMIEQFLYENPNLDAKLVAVLREIVQLALPGKTPVFVPGPKWK